MLFYQYVSNTPQSPIVRRQVGKVVNSLRHHSDPQRGRSGAGARGEFQGGVSEAMEAAQGDESHGEAERQNESESDLGRTKHGE